MNNAELLAQLSPAELQNLLSLAQNIKTDSNTVYELPGDIQSDLDNTTIKDRKTRNQRFVRSLTNYEGGQWTRGGATNKQLVPELKRANVEANQLVQQMYRDAEKIRHTARAATELYEDITTILEQEDPATYAQHLHTLKGKCQTLALYGYSTSKTLDVDARKTTTAAIKLPTSMRHLEETEEDDKDLALSTDDMERLYSERFQERLLQQTASRRGNGNGFGKQTYRGGRQQFGSQQRGQQKSFFGRPRSQQQTQQPTNPFRSNQPSNPTQDHSN
jgi:hypothetical protein